MKMSQFSTIAISQKRLKIDHRWVYAARPPRRFTSIESSSHRVTFTAIVPGAYPGKAKCGKNAHSLHKTVENQSLATDISLYFRNGCR